MASEVISFRDVVATSTEHVGSKWVSHLDSVAAGLMYVLLWFRQGSKPVFATSSTFYSVTAPDSRIDLGIRTAFHPIGSHPRTLGLYSGESKATKLQAK